MQQDSINHSLLTVFLVVIESLLTLLLRFDSQLRKCAYPLVTEGSLIAIRSYLPHNEIYLTFTLKGLLFDSKMPENKDRPDIIVNAHSFEIINAVISDKQKAVNKLQFRGEEKQVQLFKEFLYNLSINNLTSNIIQGLSSRKSGDKDSKSEKEPEIDYHEKYNELKKEYNLLKIDNKKLTTQVVESKSRKQFFGAVTTFVLIFGLIVGINIGYFVM